MLPRLLLAVFVLMAMACADRPSPTEPTPIASAPAAPSSTLGPTPAGESWNLTTTSKAFTGPEDCAVYAKYLGQSDDWSMTVERSGESIRLVLSDPDDASLRIVYSGTVSSGVLTAASTNLIQGRVCG